MSLTTEVPRTTRRVLTDSSERQRLRSRHLDAEIASWVIALSGEPARPPGCQRGDARAFAHAS